MIYDRKKVEHMEQKIQVNTQQYMIDSEKEDNCSESIESVIAKKIQQPSTEDKSQNIQQSYKDQNQSKISSKSSVNILEKTRGNKLTNLQKQAIQKTLAQKFITIGFGYIINKNAVIKRHKIAIDASYYNNTMSSIVRKSFRALQKFLISDCKQHNIKPISHDQGSHLRSPMLQCARWLKKEELDTFYKFICRLYDLKKVYISEDQASRLYGQVIQTLRQQHEVSHLILHRSKKKNDVKNSQGLTFSYVPSSQVTNNSSKEGVRILNKFVQD